MNLKPIRDTTMQGPPNSESSAPAFAVCGGAGTRHSQSGLVSVWQLTPY
jgi:hypothetical protein